MLRQRGQHVRRPGEGIGFYLSVLQDLHLVERRVPVTERRPDKSRKGIYYLRFWFRFLAPHFTLLESGHSDLVARRTAAELPTFTGPVFEDICRDWVLAQGATGRWPFVPERVGAWWDRRRD